MGAGVSRADVLKRAGAGAIGVAAVGALARSESASAGVGTSGTQINICDRGAKGDGVTDNTAIIQGALDEIRAAGGGELYIPGTGGGGRVFMTQGLWVPSNTRIVSDGAQLRASGPGPSRAHSGDGDPIPADGLLTIAPQINSGESGVRTNVFVENVELVGNSRIKYGIWADGVRLLRIRGVHIAGTTYEGISLARRMTGVYSTPYPIELVRIVDTAIEYCGENGIAVITGHDVVIDRCWISNISAGPAGGPGAGIDVEPNQTTDLINGITISSTQIVNTWGAGIILSAPPGGNGNSQEFRDITISGCRVHANGTGGNVNERGGVKFAAAGEAAVTPGYGVVVSGNHIFDNGGDPMWGDHYGTLVVTGNVFKPGDYKVNTHGNQLIQAGNFGVMNTSGT